MTSAFIQQVLNQELLNESRQICIDLPLIFRTRSKASTLGSPQTPFNPALEATLMVKTTVSRLYTYHLLEDPQP